MFARGVAYVSRRKYDTGLLRGKRALVSVTTGTSADTDAPGGIDGNILNVLWPIHNGLFLHPAEDYGPNERLKPGITARSGIQRNV